MYMLDTNACIDFLLGRSRPLADRVGQAFGRLKVSAISAAELRVGNRTSEDPTRDLRRVDVFLSTLDTLAFDDLAADTYGRLGQRIGTRRGSFDRLIAAHALALNLILVTNNERDFAGIPGLAVENWTR